MSDQRSARPFLLVTGSRGIIDEPLIRAHLDAHPSAFSTVIVGDARGVDRIAARWAERAGIPVRVFAADWSKHGLRAGYLRNVEMVKVLDPSKGDTCLALWDGKSKGTKHTIDLVMRAKVSIRIEFCPVTAPDQDLKTRTGI